MHSYGVIVAVAKQYLLYFTSPGGFSPRSATNNWCESICAAFARFVVKSQPLDPPLQPTAPPLHNWRFLSVVLEALQAAFGCCLYLPTQIMHCAF
jgi:hypothetical protein